MDNTPQEIQKPRNSMESLNCAIEGILFAAKTQRHMRYHYIIAATILLTSLILNLPMLEFILFALTIIILLFAEMFNTAVEQVVDLVYEKHHIMAKQAKDIAAGAVLISSVGVFIMGYVIFTKYLVYPLSLILKEAKGLSGHLAVISLLIVLIAVVFSKAYFHKGRPLHGGMPSGHAAVAFSLWVSITFISLNPMVSIFTFVMAIMASHSRLIAGIHTPFEVMLGGILGAGLTFLVFYLFVI